MGVKVITPPTQVITTADMRLHLRLAAGDTTEDPLLVSYLAAAVAFAQHYTGRSIGSQTLELALDAFPTSAVELLRGPVTAISSIKYINTAGTQTTLSNALYTLDDYGLQAWAVQKYNTAWPDTEASANSVKIQYVAGDVPDVVKSALLLMVGHLYENREASAQIDLKELPLGIKALLDTVRIWSM